MSGISAGKKLHDAGYNNFQILEASDRVGGRMLHRTIGGHVVEIGAMWIYGKGSNPVYDLALKYNLSFTESYSDDWTVLDENGGNVTAAADDAYDALDKVLEDLGSFAAKARLANTEDFSVRAGIRHFGWLPNSVVEDAVEA